MTQQTILREGTGVALVHDYLTQLGGAERVAGIMAKALPSAGLHTTVHDIGKVPVPLAGGREWATTFLQPLSPHLPLKAMLPLLPRAVASLDVRDAEVVLSSSSAFAHHVRPAAGSIHVCYCATPAHFLWNTQEYFRTRPGLHRSLEPLLAVMRRGDLAAARRVDAYIANSRHTARRIEQVYGREATVVYPPVEVSRFQPGPERSGRFVVVSRLVATKHVDLVVDTANLYGLPVDVIGSGPELAALRRRAGSTVRVLGWQDDATVRSAMAASEGVIVAAEEDFGLVMAEAQASGRPPIALASGGALEIIEDGTTGFLFDQQTPKDLAEAMYRARYQRLATADLVASARRFDVTVFLSALEDAVLQARRREGVAIAQKTPIGAPA